MTTQQVDAWCLLVTTCGHIALVNRNRISLGIIYFVLNSLYFIMVLS